MKNLLKYFMFAVIGAVLIATAVVTTGCDRARRELVPPDSVFQNRMDAYLPVAMQKMYEFNNPIDVVLYKAERARQLEADSIILSLSDQQISNICSVLLKQQKQFGISDIVYEYKANKRIYSALPDTPLPPVEQKPETVPDTSKIIQFEAL